MGPKMHVFEGEINQIHDSISRHMICEVCKKTSLKSPIQFTSPSKEVTN